ncbi:MAG: hypothetical protein BWK72_20835 [Rhodoferax ferrireducens]|uniref:DUF3999 domain-containing protein n=1 Tax=Rhodoferax ferrireducens TaxID=192843 RepID=A0A1W9KNI9_9BURK|nr:MAG: hypothetical protein BWK72_20835 [Rhodoferax ferrireducens]
MVFLVLLAGVINAAEHVQDFNWRALVKADTSAPYYRVTLPVEAYLNTAQPGFADLRVFNAAGEPVPFARTAPSGSSERSMQRTTLRWFPLREAVASNAAAGKLDVTVRQSGDGTLVEVHSAAGKPENKSQAVRGYLLDASKLVRHESAQALELDWQGGNDGFQLLDIEASDNLQDWRSVQRNVQLARLDFNGERIERRRIELAGLPGRYLKLQWRDPAIAPELVRAEIEQGSAHWKAPPLAWSAQIAPLRSALNLQPGEFHYRLEQALPISRIRIVLPQGNVLLPLQILQPIRERRDWHGIAHGVVYRINSNNREWIQDEIALSGPWLKEFIVRFDPRSSRNISQPTMQIGIAPEQVVFLAEGAAPYELAVGNGKMASGALPLATLVPGLGAPNAPHIAEAVLASGAASVMPASSPASALQPQADWKKIALWGVLIAGVLAMAAMAWQLVRQMDRKE